MNTIEMQEGVLLVPFAASKDRPIFFVIKRLFDIIIGLFGSMLIIPLALIIKIVSVLNKDFAPIFFVQERIGLNGKKIKILKFRSMIPDAERVLEELMAKDPKIRQEYLINKKLEKDPRITKIGRFIRKTSIDEFPQFLNVLIGEMSFVGPRPYLFREIADMGDCYDTVIRCKPGITGLWQVSGRNDISFDYRIKMDKLYFLERSLMFDISIIFKTFRAVFKRNGAK